MSIQWNCFGGRLGDDLSSLLAPETFYVDPPDSSRLGCSNLHLGHYGTPVARVERLFLGGYGLRALEARR